jgi:hypothetical protein
MANLLIRRHGRVSGVQVLGAGSGRARRAGRGHVCNGKPAAGAADWDGSVHVMTTSISDSAVTIRGTCCRRGGALAVFGGW